MQRVKNNNNSPSNHIRDVLIQNHASNEETFTQGLMESFEMDKDKSPNRSNDLKDYINGKVVVIQEKGSDRSSRVAYGDDAPSVLVSDATPTAQSVIMTPQVSRHPFMKS